MSRSRFSEGCGGVLQESKKGDKEEDEKKRGKGEPEPKKPAGDAASCKKSSKTSKSSKAAPKQWVKEESQRVKRE
jgi:hypothetical protein